MARALQPPIAPPRLRRGDTIGFVAPSSPQRDDNRLKGGIAYFRSKGYQVLESDHLWERHGYLAGTDADRAADLNAMFRNPDVRMVIPGRGGYGVTRILDRVDFAALARDPKIVVGFSDVTALNLAILRRSGIISFSGAMAGVDFWSAAGPNSRAARSFWHAVTQSRPVGRLVQPRSHRIQPVQSGSASGRLVPANLTLLASLVGTPFLPDLAGTILLLEEIGEEPYRVDRLLSQLDNAGILKSLSGMAFGAFTGAEPRRVSVDSLPLEDVLLHYAQKAGVPAVQGLLYGHIDEKFTLPVGALAAIDGDRGTLSLLEPGVS